MKLILFFALAIFLSARCADIQGESLTTGTKPMKAILNVAKRIPTSDGWFEVIKLPNEVYAFYEPGHAEQVNSFLILGEEKDLLFDTGMGIANIGNAIVEQREAEGLPEQKTMVLNSHGHLDHIGCNSEFEEVYAYRTNGAFVN